MPDRLSLPRRIFASQAAWILFFALLTVLTRAQSLRTEVIDWDESTYILMASELLHGHLPYLHVWEIKPPAYFFALAAAMDVFGENLVTVRAFGAICLLIASIITFEVCRLRNDTAASGVAVAVMISVAALFQPTMTEYLVIVFLMVSVWLALAWRGSPWSAFLVGVFISLATLTRTNIGYCAVALGLYYAFEFVRLRSSRQLYAVCAYIVGGILPLLALGLVYWAAGGLDRFVLSAFTVPLFYSRTGIATIEALRTHAEAWWKVLANHPVLYGSYSLLLSLGLISFCRRAVQGRTETESGASDRMILLLFAVSLLISILQGGRAFSHYWIQMFPFAAIFVSYALSDRNTLWVRGTANALAASAILAALVRFAPDSVATLRHWPRFETAHFVRQMAELIAADKQESDQVYALDWHLVYWYLGQHPPSYIAHPLSITDESITQPLIERGYLDADEFDRILSSRPRYIVKRPGKVQYLDEARSAVLERALSEHYELWKSTRKIEVFKLRAGAGRSVRNAQEAGIPPNGRGLACSPQRQPQEWNEAGVNTVSAMPAATRAGWAFGTRGGLHNGEFG